MVLTLVNRAVELLFAEKTDIFTARPYSVGEKYPYSSWNSIVSQIGRKLEERQIVPETLTISVLSGVFHDFMTRRSGSRILDAALPSERNPVTIGKMLADLVVRLSGETHPVFIFEDLHWFDTQALHLLRAFLSEIGISLTIFLTSRPENVLSVSELLYGLRTPIPYEFTQIQLMPFGAEETMHFCRAFLPEEVISRRGEDYFFGRSEGMPLLLVEMLKILSDNPDADCSAGLKGVIMSRMEELSPLQREVLPFSPSLAGAPPSTTSPP